MLAVRSCSKDEAIVREQGAKTYLPFELGRADVLQREWIESEMARRGKESEKEKDKKSKRSEK